MTRIAADVADQVVRAAVPQLQWMVNGGLTLTLAGSGSPAGGGRGRQVHDGRDTPHRE